MEKGKSLLKNAENKPKNDKMSLKNRKISKNLLILTTLRSEKI